MRNAVLELTSTLDRSTLDCLPFHRWKLDKLRFRLSTFLQIGIRESLEIKFRLQYRIILAFGCSAASILIHFALRMRSSLFGDSYIYSFYVSLILKILSITLSMFAFVMGTEAVLHEKKSIFGFGLPGNIALFAFATTFVYVMFPDELAFIFISIFFFTLNPICFSCFYS